MADHDSSRTPTNCIDLTEQRFERLLVLGRAPIIPGKDRSARWLCRCDCGNEVVVSSAALKRRPGAPSTKSCGCLNRDQHVKHGQATKNSHTVEYRAWTAAKSRCFKPKHQAYSNYGGRGVVMCDGWKDDFVAFFTALGQSFGLELDRKDNDGHYSCGKCAQCIENHWPLNCRWATRKTQGNNRRTNRFIEYRGETLTVKELAERTGLGLSTLLWRLDHKWPIEKALVPPLQLIPTELVRS